MFTRRIKLFQLFGFDVTADASWLILAVLVTWSLAVGVFPHYFEGLSVAAYWWMGAAGAAGLFVSIVLHEIGHALVARRYGIPIKDITLFVFGGVAEMQDEPANAKSEFLMAIAGPGISVAIGVLLYVISLLGGLQGQVSPVFGVISYLAWLNGVLAVFNMLPAFPLDGGRVLRAILWGWRGNLRWATQIAATIGTGFGWVFVVLGVVTFLNDNLIAGLWWLLIGLFMRFASQMSYRQVLMRRALEGESLRRFMQSDPVTVPPLVSLRHLVDDYVYRFHYKMYPIVDQGKLLGCVTTRHVKEIPREEWEQYTVREIMEPCSQDNSIQADQDPMKALTLMNQTGNSRLMVVEDSHLVGIITLKDLLNFLSLKLDLQD